MKETALNYTIIDHYTQIRFTGKKAKTFLQNQLTCDLNQIDEQKSAFCAYANLQGRLSSLFYICQENDDIIVILPSSLAKQTADTLHKYGVFSRVNVAIESQFQFMGVYGQNAKSTLEKCLNDSFKSDTDFSTIVTDSGIRAIELPAIVPAYLIALTENQLDELKGHMHSDCYANIEKWQQLMIESKIPQLSDHTTESFLPSELELDRFNSISLEKGCFLGQEVIARMKYRGKSKKALKKVIITSDQLNELDFTCKVQSLEGKQAGDLVNFIQINDNQAKALVVMLKARLNETSFQIPDINGEVIIEA